MASFDGGQHLLIGCAELAPRGSGGSAEEAVQMVTKIQQSAKMGVQLAALSQKIHEQSKSTQSWLISVSGR